MGTASSRLRRPFRVLLCGYYGFGNLGDELLAQSLVALLVKTGLDRREIALLSADPAGSRAALGVASFDRWSPGDVITALSRSRTLLLGGGGLFQDSTSLRSPLFYGAVVALARLMGCRPWSFGQSVGPLRSALGRMVARGALAACPLVFVRDEPSRALLESWGISAFLSPDPVLALEPQRLSSRGEALLVNLRPWGDLPVRAAEAVTAFAEERGLSLVGVAMASEDEALMDRLCREGRLPLTELLHLKNLFDVGPAWARGGSAVGMRLHFNVLSLVEGVSSVAIPYDPKVRAFAEAWEIPLWEGKGRIAFPVAGEKGRDANLRAAGKRIEDDLALARRRMEEVSDS